MKLADRVAWISRGEKEFLSELRRLGNVFLRTAAVGGMSSASPSSARSLTRRSLATSSVGEGEREERGSDGSDTRGDSCPNLEGDRKQSPLLTISDGESVSVRLSSPESELMSSGGAQFNGV